MKEKDKEVPIFSCNLTLAVGLCTFLRGKERSSLEYPSKAARNLF